MAYTWTDLTFAGTLPALAATYDYLYRKFHHPKAFFEELGVHSTPFVADEDKWTFSPEKVKEFMNLQKDLAECLAVFKNALRTQLQCGGNLSLGPIQFSQDYGEQVKNAQTLVDQFNFLAQKYKKYLSGPTNASAAGQFYEAITAAFRNLDTNARQLCEKTTQTWMRRSNQIPCPSISTVFEEVWKNSPLGKSMDEKYDEASALASDIHSVAEYHEQCRKSPGAVTPIERFDAFVQYQKEEHNKKIQFKFLCDNDTMGKLQEMHDAMIEKLDSSTMSVMSVAKSFLELFMKQPAFSELKDNPFYQYLINEYIIASWQCACDIHFPCEMRPPYYGKHIVALHKIVDAAKTSKDNNTGKSLERQILDKCQEIAYSMIQKRDPRYQSFALSQFKYLMPSMIPQAREQNKQNGPNVQNMSGGGNNMHHRP